jgi:hypothetical protein
MNVRVSFYAVLPLTILTGLGFVPAASAGTLAGHVRDPNWFARRADTDPFGVGYYEYAVNANGVTLTSLGGLAATDVYGAFQTQEVPAGFYTVASWDVWWRSAFAFNVSVPASGPSADVDLRLRATMWGYPAFWGDTGYYEFGQTFVASGPITMIFIRNPLSPSPTHTLTVHEGGPGGPQVGRTRTFSGYWDNRIIYGRGDLPTVAGRTYYLRIRTPSPATKAVLCQMDPRPDYSDPMPGGCLWLGDGTTLTPYPDRDLGVILMADDDGLITGLFARASGPALSGVTTVGQSFIARGTNLISATFWLADPSAPTYVVRVLQDGPGGTPVGITKRGKPARLTADPQMLVTWAPGECRLVAGQTYYVEVSKDGGGTFNSVYANNSNPFLEGQAYTNGLALPGSDLAGTIMEEEGNGSATRPTVKITADPAVSEADRGTNWLRIRWTTDVSSDSLVEYAVEHPPYTMSLLWTQRVTAHVVTLSNLQPHTLYHFRVSSGTLNYRPVVSRDFVICTRPAASNLLANPGFEEGVGAEPARPLAGWSSGGTGLDIKQATSGWFGGLPPHSGTWLLEGALNGASSDAYVYQRVSGATPGREYTFSAWVLTAMRENNTWKYDEWDERGRLIYLRLGVDPNGGTSPTNASVQWTPRTYSHRRYTQLARSVVADASNLTVFISMKGDGGQWHLSGVDDCALTTEDIPTRFTAATLGPDGSFQATLASRANRTNVLEASTTLTNWNLVTNVLNAKGTVEFSDAGTTNTARRFFRARTLP